ncbi:NAD(P)/FAD-dependent oxidoreductase [Labedaea rhizosphaerae]|uniref:NAD/ferredoxin-dependent reductase-like protein n=1 Tax=Labedaea rhizosphaerae TaxID=598644 RepID=A0A4R6SFA3_LABRH|nr:FAD-dependent oxidoreductase [Labedaea rhizosphaerae]TDP97875.1 NAD/ferredoxin-dependent reductase-like protein [Labedaea rhizosphaerae]
MTSPQRIVIIGSGLAGGSAAAALRERGYDGGVTIIGNDPNPPYELPALSKQILLGDAEEPDWVRPKEFWAEHDIELVSGATATAVRLGNRVVVDDKGTEHPYDRLLLATGSAPRSLPVPGADLDGLRTLRTLDDSRALRDLLTEGTKVVIVGAGWIGCEAAAAARKHGADVTVIDPLPLPLHRSMGDECAEVFRDLHAENGVSWRLGVGVEGFTGEGTVSGVRLAGGETLKADLVLVAVGAAPRLELAKAAGLELSDSVAGGGVDVDSALRTSAPDVCAAGDITAHYHPRYERRIRVEHWANAKDQGTHVAGTLLGETTPYTKTPYFFSDQYDLGMEVRGLANPFTDELVVRGDLKAREFTAFWLRAGKVLAAMNVNMWDDGEALQALVDGDMTVTADQLTGAELSSLV